MIIEISKTKGVDVLLPKYRDQRSPSGMTSWDFYKSRSRRKMVRRTVRFPKLVAAGRDRGSSQWSIKVSGHLGYVT